MMVEVRLFGKDKINGTGRNENGVYMRLMWSQYMLCLKESIFMNTIISYNYYPLIRFLKNNSFK